MSVLRFLRPTLNAIPNAGSAHAPNQAPETSYAEWARLKNETYYEDGRKRLLAMFPESAARSRPPIPKHAKDAIWRVATDVRLQTNDLESRLQAIEKTPFEGRPGLSSSSLTVSNSPTKLPRTHKLSLAFDALVLSEATGCDVSFGKIMHGDGHTTSKVKLPALVSDGAKRDTDLTALLATIRHPTLY